MDYKTEAQPKATAGGVPVFCAHDAIVAIEKLIPNPKNPNTHPDAQIQALGRIIRQTGWRAPITVSKRSGFIVKGHGRLAAAKLEAYRPEHDPGERTHRKYAETRKIRVSQTHDGGVHGYAGALH